MRGTYKKSPCICGTYIPELLRLCQILPFVNIFFEIRCFTSRVSSVEKHMVGKKDVSVQKIGKKLINQ
jgi:hypothetical protein